MQPLKSLITTDIDFERNGFQASVLYVPYSHDRSAYGRIPIPIAVLKQGEGPTLLLTGGNHGDEYEGPVALTKLMQRMLHMELSGRLIVIPALNFPAFVNGSRTSPIDKGNLNRVFPGKRNGSITEMIAHYVDTELVPRADVILDLHAGGASFDHLPTILASLPEEAALHDRYIALVDAFGAPTTLIMNLLGEDRTFCAAAERRGKLFLCGEFGGGASCDLAGLQIVEDGIARLLHRLGMTETAPLQPSVATRLQQVEGASHYVFTPHGGVVEPSFSLGDWVEKGQLAGRLYDPQIPWEPPRELRFVGTGRVICARTLAKVEAGDCLAVLASDTHWD